MLLSLIATKIRNWRRYRETVSELSRLTDRELEDLGIARWDIRFVAKRQTFTRQNVA